MENDLDLQETHLHDIFELRVEKMPKALVHFDLIKTVGLSRYSQIPIKWNSIFKVWLRKSLNFFPFYRISISEAQTKKVSQRLSIFDSVSCLLHSMFT